MINFEELTGHTIRKIQGSDLLEGAPDQRDCIRQFVKLTASSYSETLKLTRGQEIQFLSDWHGYVVDECSATYEAAQLAQPTANREDLNASPELTMLNGIRSGLRAARKVSNRQLH